MEICILDATKPPSGIGYANDTIPNFDKEECVYREMRDIDTNNYPEIRIQVNLVANGTDRPTLQAWSLYYVPRDEWRDEFLGDWRMSEHRGFNFTGDELEINLTHKSGGGPGTYSIYPPVAYTLGDAFIYYTNASHTGYEDRVSFDLRDTLGSVHDTIFFDVNDDGYLDLLYSGGTRHRYCGAMVQGLGRRPVLLFSPLRVGI